MGRAAIGTALALTVAVVAQRWGENAVRWFLPTMQARLQDLLPEFRIASFAVLEATGQMQLTAQVLLLRPLQIGHHVVDELVWANAAITLGAFWQPVAVAMATAAVWPWSLRRILRIRTDAAPGAMATRRFATLSVARVLAVVSACVAATALSVVLAPSMLAGLIIGDIYWHEASEQIIPHIVRLPRLLEEGGWLLLGLSTGSLCTTAAQWPLTWCAPAR
ncbi:MAG TPA: hypothetical protein VEI29_00805 [Burkholderiaceae bacterium]|nr:hypothetical protein [Burkholderiaceae bacterium]